MAKISNVYSAGIVAIVVIAGVVVFVLIRGAQNNPTIVFSPPSLLEAVWLKYKMNYVNSDGRTIDPSKGGVTTSEGQSYTMLRAVWQDDHETFDSTWDWTEKNLMMKNTSLFSWLYGTKANGQVGILTDKSGQNSASDADTDIAVALLFAYSRWRDPKYLASAENIVKSIWNGEVITVGNRPYLASNNIEKLFTGDVAVNPSYFAPYAYRMFEAVDPSHDWNALIDTSYEVMNESMTRDLGSTKSVDLPPDWIFLDRMTAEVKRSDIATSKGVLDTYYGFDALRIPWRVALDWKWYGDSRALQILKRFSFLNTEWQDNHVLNGVYTHDGRVIEPVETPAMYGGSIGAFVATDVDQAHAVYAQKLVGLFNPDSDSWKMVLSYYDDNWVWFGIALYNDLLPNLWSSVNGTT